MALYLATDTEITSIADAIRTKGGTSAALLFPTDFVTAIQSIPSGASLTTLNATANGTYTPTGYDGYSTVTVAIPTYNGGIQ